MDSGVNKPIALPVAYKYSTCNYVQCVFTTVVQLPIGGSNIQYSDMLHRLVARSNKLYHLASVGSRLYPMLV